jgi:predicted dehydrogenase
VSARPVHIAFLGCGFITRVHSRHLPALGRDVVWSFASRDPEKAEAYRRKLGGVASWDGYQAAIDAPEVDAVVVGVPPRYHLDLTLRALDAGKHVLVEKPAFPELSDYDEVVAARDRADRVVIVGENDHYKPLAVELRKLLDSGVIGDLLFGHFATVMRKPKTADDWRNDEDMAGGDAFFEEGIHWLHVAGSLGHRITRITGYRPDDSDVDPLEGDSRTKSMLVSFEYDSGAAGALFYSREIPTLLRGLGRSRLYGREGVITFESNGGFVFVRGRGWPKLRFPGFRDIRGYRAMYEDFVRAIGGGPPVEMSVERAREDHLLMEQVYQSLRKDPDRRTDRAAGRGDDA